MNANQQNIESLAQRMKITILNQGFWNPKRPHQAETNEENRRHGLDNDVEVRIKLIKHDSLSKAQAVKAQIYNAHKKLTLPSPVDGMRIVPAGREFEHAGVVSNLTNEFDKYIAEFLNDYDKVIEAAEKRLGVILYDKNMFPTKEEMTEKFYNKCKYMETPTTGSWGDWINETVQLGQIELQERLVGAARKLIETCSNDGRLYSSVLDNLSDICDLAGDLNLMEDPIIAKAAKELNTVATDFSADVLRENKVLKMETANRAAKILSIFNLS